MVGNFGNAILKSSCPGSVTSKVFSLVVLFAALQSPAFAGKWFFTPSIDVRETFSDNINLAPSGDELSAFVTEINPGISVVRFGGKTNLNLNYRMQNIINQGGGGGVNVHHQFQANSNTELSSNRLFLNARSTVSQQNIVNTGRLSTDNLNNLANRADVYTVSVSPLWTPRFGGYANGLFQFGYDFVDTGSALAETTNTFAGKALLTSGYKFNQVTWRLGYNHTVSERDQTPVAGIPVGSNDVKLRNYDGEVRYWFTRKYSVFVQAGYFDNDFAQTTGTNQNGAYYTFGGAWRPSHRFTLEGGYGINQQFIGFFWNPTLRTNIAARFRHSDVGTNTGDVWNASISHRTARVVLTARYFEDTTTIQDILLDQNVFNTTDAFGQAITDPVTSQTFNSNLGLPSFTNQVLVRKRGEFSISGQTAKSVLNLTVFHSRRTSQVTQNRDRSFGLSTGWSWQITPRTFSRLQFSWNRNSNSGPVQIQADQDDDIYLGTVRVTRNIADYFNISKGIFGSLEYRFFLQDSSNSASSFLENRVTASLAIRF